MGFLIKLDTILSLWFSGSAIESLHTCTSDGVVVLLWCLLGSMPLLWRRRVTARAHASGVCIEILPNQPTISTFTGMEDGEICCGDTK